MPSTSRDSESTRRAIVMAGYDNLLLGPIRHKENTTDDAMANQYAKPKTSIPDEKQSMETEPSITLIDIPAEKDDESQVTPIDLADAICFRGCQCCAILLTTIVVVSITYAIASTVLKWR